MEAGRAARGLVRRVRWGNAATVVAVAGGLTVLLGFLAGGERVDEAPRPAPARRATPLPAGRSPVIRAPERRHAGFGRHRTLAPRHRRRLPARDPSSQAPAVVPAPVPQPQVGPALGGEFAP